MNKNFCKKDGELLNLNNCISALVNKKFKIEKSYNIIK